MSQYDLVIRGGTVVDGCGGAPLTADVAVANGVIVEVGSVGGRGRREIDADGAVVAPGFVDIHTHYDAQATWDSRLQPSSWHGVTTVVMGNCGVGFAPVVANDRDRLINLMAGVEDIPGVTMHEGLAWDWNSFPEYLDALERRPHDIDLAAQVPHAALRVRAMGERAAAREPATDEEIATMARLAQEAIQAGALGFTTSRALAHKSIDGQVTPSYGAGLNELAAISAAIGATGKGVLQLATDFDDPEIDFAIIRRMLTESRRPMSFSLIQKLPYPERYKKVLALLDAVNEDGFELRAQVAARAIGVMIGLQCTLHPFLTNPVWKSELADLPVAEQARRMSDPEMKHRIFQAQTGEKPENLVGGLRIDVWDAMYNLTDPPNYEPDPRDCVTAHAERAGVSPESMVYDIMIADEGRGMIYQTFVNYAYENLDAVREMLAHKYTIPGLSDGGAHAGTICDGSFPTSLLQYWVRDRAYGNLDLEFVIQRQCRDTARAVGLHDRGQLTPGFKADINVIDLDNLKLHRPEVHYDLPANGRRLLQRADGYKHTFVSGVETYHDGTATDALPGTLVRGAQQPRAVSA